MSSDGHDTTPPIPSSSEVLLNVRIDRICEQFEELLKAGQSPQIENYLGELPEDHQGTLLEELLGLELDYRAKAGDSFTAEEYTRRFPEHSKTVTDLVVNVRRQSDRPPGDDRKDKRSTQKKTSSDATRQSSLVNGPVRIGPYEILEPCGRGGMGVVYKAWHELFKQYRAIKVLPANFDEDDIGRFSMEIELAGRLNHPHIVRAHEANREQGVLYLVMEYVDGINLDQLVKQHKQIPWGLACEMIRQAAEGLQHAHEHFLVHRDLKPSNMMINRQGQVKILDFGLARLHAEQNASRLTKQGSVMGTLDFMAPEQWEDPMGATIQADIYSLGCTLFYLVTGTPPYGGEDYSHWLKKQEAHRNHPVPQIEHERAEELQPIIDRMMAKDRKERFQIPIEVVRALEPLADPTELKRYAETPAPKLATAGVSRSPLPTVNMTGSGLLDRDVMEQLAEQFTPGDSEVNSKEKTLRPQSRTDLESERGQPTAESAGRPSVLWYRSRAWQSVLLVSAFVALFAAWSVLRPPQNVELAEEMGALPGLNGGWWFEEMPWYGPSIRKALMTALRDGDTDVLGVPVEEFQARLIQSDTIAVQNDLKSIAGALRPRLSDRELLLADQMLLFPESGDQVGVLTSILEKHEFAEGGPINKERLAEYSATELHWLAALLHRLSIEKSQYAGQAEQVYQMAIKAYDENDEVEHVLLAVARSDLSRFLGELRNYTDSIVYGNWASDSVPSASLFQISLRCEMADQHRRWDGFADKVEPLLKDHPDSAEALADHIGLADDHPLRAEIRERLGWYCIDTWQMQRAIEVFETAIAIRIENEKNGNPFAWRPLLFDNQGQAMAKHFLGQDEEAITIYERLIEGIQARPDEAAEQRERLPNLYERKGDALMFGPNPDRARAAEAFGHAIVQANRQGFNISATLWFHLTRLYYKRALALLLFEQSPDFEHVQAILGEAQNLEDHFKGQMSDDPEAFRKQQAAYALERDVALGVLSLKETMDESDNIKKDLEKLQGLIINTAPSRVNRWNVEVLLLVFEKLFEHVDYLDTNTLAPQKLGSRLLTFTDAMRKGNPAIRTQYLAPLFRDVANALPESAAELKADLEAVIRPGDSR